MRDQGCLSPCRKGGIAIHVNKKLQFSVKEIPCNSSECITGIKPSLSNKTLLFILWVYLPYDGNILKLK